MQKNTQKPFVDNRQLARAEAYMKTDPSFLAQNNRILDGSKFNTVQDLTKIGEAVFPGHVVEVKQPNVMPLIKDNPILPQSKPMQIITPSSIPRVQNEEEMKKKPIKILTEVPEHIAKIVEEHREKQNSTKSFEDALSDSSTNHNSEDNFEPDKSVYLPEEIHNSPMCKYNPCLNGGLCTAHPERYYCSCKPGWIGLNCERRSNCMPNPCHHGTCWPNADGYTCTCKLGYKGSKCDMLDRCHPDPCLNSGICTETLHGVQCECAIGFKGRLCEMESKCEPINPCMNGGICREFTDHYQCSCSPGFKGENCEEFIAPTKPPPTAPVKHVGPQAIPAPDNLPTGELHEIYTEKYTDASGKLVTNSQESFGPINKGINPGFPMVPHPVAAPEPQDSSPFSNTPSHSSVNEHSPSHNSHNEFQFGTVGLPTAADDKFIIHDKNEDKNNNEKPNKPIEDEKGRKVLSSDDITGNDDRYQTHLVQTMKDKPLNPLTVHVGKAIPETSASITPASHANEKQEIEGRKELSQIKSGNKETVQTLNNDHNTRANNADSSRGDKSALEFHTQVSDSAPFSNLHLNEAHGSLDTDNTQTIIVNSASTRSSLPKVTVVNDNDSTLNNEKDNNAVVKNDTNILSTNTNLGEKHQKNGTISIIEKENNNNATAITREKISKLQDQINNMHHTETLKVNKLTKNEYEKADKAINKINEQMQNQVAHIQQNHPVTSPSFVKQKNAYSAWRRKALTNFHKRNPNKPLPKNTLSLSKNSLCPPFCRLYCDPWCVKIGCCKSTKDQQAMFQKIEKENEINNINSNPSPVTVTSSCGNCNENADCVNKKCQCKTGFHGDGRTCTIDNCLLCHMDADCYGERCTCKKGFFGDGYECKSNSLRKELCSKCHKKADCIGGDCFCARGFYGNGKSCWPLPIDV